MEVKVVWIGGQDSADITPATESDVWKWIASHLPNISIPNEITIEVNGNRGLLSVTQRGTVQHPDGTSSPSMYVIEDLSCNFMLAPSTYDDAYMVCINPYGNNYKFYWFRPDNVARVLNAQYGRIGSMPGDRFGAKDLQTPYPSYMYWIRYYEKLSKGYKDMTDVYLNDRPDQPDQPKETEKLPDVKEKTVEESQYHDSQASLKLYAKLLQYAKQMVDRTLAKPKDISWGQIAKSKELYSKLCVIANTITPRAKNHQMDLFQDCDGQALKSFNAILEELMTVCPRNVFLVTDFLAKSEDDFSAICDREESLINAMEAVKTGEKPKETLTERKEGWLQFGIDVEDPNEQERKHIISLIDPSMRNQVKEIYMVNPDRQRSAFNAYCSENNISEVKELFHGSGLENWFSITQHSLLLPQHNHARKTGQALGMGLYFGNCSVKASHYASRGTNYIVGVFDVAYGKPLKIKDRDHNCYWHHDQKELDDHGCNCVHYHRRGVNWADEIVVFSERAVCMKALIVF